MFLTVLEKGTVDASASSLFATATSIGICCVEVKYTEAKSSLIFSVTGIQPSELADGDYPFLKIDIGLPFSPELDQLFFIFPADFEVLPNLKLLPNLPSVM